MMRHFARRSAHAAFLLFGVSLLTFLFVELAPGEFLSEVRLNPQVSRETVEGLRKQHGLEGPMAVRYARYLNSIVHGDLGQSVAYNMPAAALLRTRTRNTLLLTALATALAWIIAIPVGVWASLVHGRWRQRLFGGTTSLMLATPELMIALALLMFAVRTRRFSAGGMTSADFAELSLGGKAADLASHFALPVLAIVIAALPVLVRHVRSSMLDALNSPSVQAARYHGLARRTVLFRYALRLAANPLISMLGLSIATLLSGSLLVEVVMGWPGLGPLLLEAALGHDVNVVVGAALFSTLFVVGGNLLADFALYFADPRIREGHS